MKDFLSFFKDSHGRWAIIQFPNMLLLIWLGLLLVSILLARTPAAPGMDHVKDVVLFTWAYGELTSGTSGFRRVLGGIIMIAIIIGFFI